MNIFTLMTDVRGVIKTREIKRLLPVVSCQTAPFVGPLPAPVLTEEQKEIAAWNAAVAAKRAARKSKKA